MTFYIEDLPATELPFKFCVMERIPQKKYPDFVREIYRRETREECESDLAFLNGEI